VDFTVINGSPQSSTFKTGETGTYTINYDCTGTATFVYPDGTEIELELVVVNQGREFFSAVKVLDLYGSAVPANIGSHGVRVDEMDSGTENQK